MNKENTNKVTIYKFKNEDDDFKDYDKDVNIF